MESFNNCMLFEIHIRILVLIVSTTLLENNFTRTVSSLYLHEMS